jgi:hypothetical protein
MLRTVRTNFVQVAHYARYLYAASHVLRTTRDVVWVLREPSSMSHHTHEGGAAQ